MNFFRSYARTLSDYVKLSGRASRKEYWTFKIINMAIMISLAIAITPELSAFCVVLLFLPSLGVTIRRLHDINKSGWFILLILIPFGSLVILIFSLLPSDEDMNRYGVLPEM